MSEGSHWDGVPVGKLWVVGFKMYKFGNGSLAFARGSLRPPTHLPCWLIKIKKLKIHAEPQMMVAIM